MTYLFCLGSVKARWVALNGNGDEGVFGLADVDLDFLCFAPCRFRSWAYSSTPMCRWPASIAIFSAVLPSLKTKDSKI